MMRVQPADLPEGAVLVDIRDELEAAGRPLEEIAGGRAVVRAPLANLEEGLVPDLPGGVPVVVVCENGTRSELGGAYLQADGATAVSLLDGGVRGWRQFLEGPELTLEFRVPSATDPARAEAIRRRLELIDGVRQAGVSPGDGRTVVRGTASLDSVRAGLRIAGHDLELD